MPRLPLATLLTSLASAKAALPANFDWRDTKGAVQAVRDQGKCGNSQSFAAAAVLETADYLTNMRSNQLSVQQFLDCVPMPPPTGGKSGCAAPDAGLETDPIIFLYSKQLGAEKDTDYPFSSGGGQDEKCTSTSCKQLVFLPSYQSNQKGTSDSSKQLVFLQSYQSDQAMWPVKNPLNEDDMAQKLMDDGPLQVMINNTQMEGYKGGIYDPVDNEKECSCLNVNHAVALVGFGTDKASGKKYWIVKNSWGSKWGEDGYMRIARGKNACGIAVRWEQPLVALDPGMKSEEVHEEGAKAEEVNEEVVFV